MCGKSDPDWEGQRRRVTKLTRSHVSLWSLVVICQLVSDISQLQGVTLRGAKPNFINLTLESEIDISFSSPLITKNRNPLNSAHGYGRRANDPRLNMVIRTLRRQHRCFTTESVLWPNNPIIGGWAVLFTP